MKTCKSCSGQTVPNRENTLTMIGRKATAINTQGLGLCKLC